MVAGVQDEAICRLGLEIAGEFVWRETAESREPSHEIIGHHNVRKLRSELGMAVVMDALDDSLLNHLVHPLDLAAIQENSHADYFPEWLHGWLGLVSLCSPPPHHGCSNRWRDHGATSQIMSKPIGREEIVYGSNAAL